MKKKSIIITLILVLIMLIGYVSWEYYNSHKVKEDIKLKNNIVKVVHNSEEVDFSKVANFKWDTLYLFTPYTDTQKILKNDSVKNYNNELNMEYNDTINIIAFVDSKKIVKYIAINRSDFDFESIDNNKTSKNKSIFKIINDNENCILSLK